MPDAGDRLPHLFVVGRVDAQDLRRPGRGRKVIRQVDRAAHGQRLRTEASDVHAYVDDAIDIHHIFPKKWCESNDFSRAVMDSVVNKTAIDSKTNGMIGGRAPSEYLERIQSTEQIESADLDAILQSHDIDPIALRQDDFASFFNHRFERLLKQIEDAIRDYSLRWM